MNEDILSKNYGQCWAFPPEFSTKMEVGMVAGTQSVMQSLKVLFLTEQGERIMRETYGGGLNDFMFENISDELLARIHSYIEDSVLRNEPRANISDITIQSAENDVSRLSVQIHYRLQGSDLSEILETSINLNESWALRSL